ncbi:helix-turn-helix and ligand-binding sensor domain-containing protein [Joostella sp. CR20]|uniref:helix-turn-helix and ligand-binding sensor domain-containing protein n=1 Tax=Joostella sp. CR20 TaxID=2804312 RepID=UPI00313CBC85
MPFYKYLKILFFINVFLCTVLSFGQRRPPIHNFSVNNYKAGIQNWGIAYGNETVYVANNEGLLEFDGNTWRLYELPHQTIVRSVAFFDDIIYTGSYEEFGFWKTTATGELAYTSLSSKLSNKSVETESIWSIHQLKDAIIFKSFSKIYIYKNDKIEVVNAEMTILGGNVINDEFYVFGRGKGVCKLVDNELVLQEETSILSDYKVQSIAKFSEDAIILGTSLNGCFIWKDGKVQPWNNPLNELMKQNQLNKMTIDKDYLFFGTIKNGVYVFNRKKSTYYNINVQNGLKNNTVLGSLYTDRGVLWLSLDNGLSAIPINFDAYYLNPLKQDIGGVYDMVSYKNQTYIATNTGIYVGDQDGFKFIEGSQGHIWDLTLVDDVIICGHNLATYQIKNNQLELISDKNGGYVFKNIPKHQNDYIQGNYEGLTKYTKTKSGWEVKTIEGLNFPVKKVVLEKDYIAWVAHTYKGVYRVHFSEDYSRVERIEEQYNNALPNIYLIKLFEIEGQIAFYNNNEWFVYNPIEQKIESFESLKTILGKDADAYPITNDGTQPLIFKKSNGMLFIREQLHSQNSQYFIPTRYYEDKLLKEDERAIVINDSVAYIALYNDILAINSKKIGEQKVAEQPKINRVFINGEPQFLNALPPLKQRDTIEIETSIPFLSNNLIVYNLSSSLHSEYRVTDKGKIILTNLPYGETVIDIRSKVKNKISEKGKQLTLEIKKPWYLGVWGGVLLIVILVLILMLAFTVNKFMLIRHKKYLEDQFEHQKELNRKEEALRHEKKLNEIQKSQHEQELKNKTKELANTALEMTKKNEILIDLKEELLHFKSEIIDKIRFNKLLKTIDKNINNANDWEIFESNFNNIHDSFFKDLLKLHPEKLTSKDLKLCAYLKMNLSTKEIAPLMSISVRGVEIHRYRLRKKLGLSSEQNINEYLMNI